MQCMYCNKIFAIAHHSCMLYHVLKVPDALAKCKGSVPPAYHQRYLQLYNSSKEKSGSKKRAADDNVIIVSDLQSNAVSTLQSSKKSSHQMTIQTGIERTYQTDIRHTNNANQRWKAVKLGRYNSWEEGNSFHFCETERGKYHPICYQLW